MKPAKKKIRYLSPDEKSRLMVVQAGVPLLDVSKLLGHVSVTTTATYDAHLAPSHASKGAVAGLNRIEGERTNKQDKDERDE